MSRPLDDDADLVARATRGDVDAYERLVHRHAQIAFRTAYLITRSAADADEAAQDGFLKAYRALHRFRSGAPFRPWLLRIVANEARNRRRAAGRRTALELRAGEERLRADAAPSSEAALLAAGERAALLAAIERLPERDRLVIACRHLLELSEAETAAALDCRPGTVKSRLSRALARLREEVGGDV
ncbi:MAG TPA: sigma-70 family RNA polymerase sigma factor [Solirubrobacteraceae bacterium]|nr:sigma-70 family RNA polymerase sigma factor [Solirubrobacteraceae bacterium]